VTVPKTCPTGAPGAECRRATLNVSISKARAKLSELVRQAADENVELMNHSTPAAVLIGAERHEAMLEEIEDTAQCA
jgi:prevent-host-death family protein